MDVPKGDDCFGEKECLACECAGRSVINDEIVALDFAWPGTKPRGGQFFLVRPERTSIFLGRPLSAAGWEPGPGGKPGTLRFLLALRGQGTRELAETRPGEKALLSGPLGRGWAAVSGDLISGGAIALVSGGVGAAPLACFAREIEGRVFDFYAGFRSGPFGLEGIKPRTLLIASEDGSFGRKGRIPGFFSPGAYRAVFACGPEAMLKIIAAACEAAGTPCFISLERRMACGAGACLGCTVKTRQGNRRCCADGPVFNAEDIIFDE